MIRAGAVSLLACGLGVWMSQEPATVLHVRQAWDGERVIANASIVIDGQRIVAVGAKLPVPKGAREIDFRRYTALPGLLDLRAFVFTRKAAHRAPLTRQRNSVRENPPRSA